MKAVIMAGGKGTRVSSITTDIPKPMIRIDGIPVLEREIICLKQQGFTDIIITVGHLKDVIMDYFGDGSEFGVHIEYFIEDVPLGNAGALFRLKNQLKEDFLLLNADALFDIDFGRFVDFHEKNQAVVTLFAHPNNHPYDSGLLVLDGCNRVQNWLNKEEVRPKYYQNIVNAGLHIISPQVLEMEIHKEKVDLDRDVLKPLAGTGKMYAYLSPEYVKDMGTEERYATVCDDLKKGIVKNKNLLKKQKAIFLDRDGTINEHIGFLTRIEEFKLLPNVAEAIRKINDSGYLAIVVTNQPVIARGEVTYDELRAIHNKMETLLGNQGAYLDGLYYCPHHPDKGFPREIKELKIKCNCRKPQPGLIYEAVKDYNIDLNSSWVIGDSWRDIELGKNVGCRTVLVNNEFGEFGQNYTAQSLTEAVEYVLECQVF